MENKTYEEAFAELQSIIKEIENGTISIDELSKKVSRASELIKLCKEKLFKTEQEVSGVLKELE
jgi:exodeoxyribonuclease VII small subunit